MKRTINVHLVLALGLGLTLALLGFLGNAVQSPAARAADLPRPASAPGDVLCVAFEGGSYPGSCTQVFTNVQAAVDAASGGETIKVATGVYTDINTYGGLRQIVYISKTVIVQGGYTTTNWTTPCPITQPTTLDAQGQGRVMYITGNISPTVEGFRITGGDAAGLGGYGSLDAGGGVYIITATTTLSANQILSNTASFLGGGLCMLQSDHATLSGNIFSDNTARSSGGGQGGGLHIGQSNNVTLDGNTISGNDSNSGGGLFLQNSSATFDRNRIISNTAVNGAGGLYLYYSTGVLTSNAILSNTGQGYVGGALLYHSATTLRDNIIQGNKGGSAAEGGGVAAVNGEAMLTGNVISNNTSEDGCGGVYLACDDATMSRNTILSNTAKSFGGGICLHGNSVVSDNIISGNVISLSYGGVAGGGVLIEPNYTGDTLVKLVNNVITDNRINSPEGVGSGVWMQGSSNVHLVHTTIARNTGGDGSGLCAEYGSTVALTNTIIVSQTVGITATSDSRAVVNGVLWFDNGANTGGPGTIAVTHAITGNPVFAPDGYHLTAGSAAIDAGVDAGVTTDIDGEHRPQGPAPDLGADEISLRYVYLPLVLRQSP